MTDTRLEAENLSRSFGEFQAVKPLDLTLTAGSVTALSGPNGSGKSTLLLCLSGLLHPTTGFVQVEGFDLYRNERQARSRLAYVPDVPVFYQELTAWEHLQFIAMAHGAMADFEERAEQLLDEFGLWEVRDQFPNAFSRGMRLKLGILLALIRPFSVLLLDEPTSALDVESIDILGEKLAEVRAAGAAVLLTSHDPDFVQQIGAFSWKMRDGYLQR